MRDHNDQLVARDLFEDLHDLHARSRIKRTRRLVCQQDLGIVDQRTGNRHTLHLSARHLVGALVDLVAKSHAFKRVNGALASFGLGNAREGQGKLYVRQHRLVGDEVVVLEHKADRVVTIGIPITVLELLGGAAADDQVARGVLVKTADHVEERRFSTTRGTEDGNELALAEGKRHTVKRHDGGALCAVNLSDFL